MNTSFESKPLIKLALATIIAGVSLNAAAMEAQFTNLAPTGANSGFVDPANPHIEVTLTSQLPDISSVSARDALRSEVTFPVTQIGIIPLEDVLPLLGHPGAVATYSIDVTTLCTEQPGAHVLLEFSARSDGTGSLATVSRLVSCY